MAVEDALLDPARYAVTDSTTKQFVSAMDAYPEDYVAHNLPFILLSGLETSSDDDLQDVRADYPLLREKGKRIYSDLPSLSGPVAEELRRVLLEEDASRIPWDLRDDAYENPSKLEYKIKSVGRVGRCKLAVKAFLPSPLHLDTGDKQVAHPSSQTKCDSRTTCWFPLIDSIQPPYISYFQARVHLH